LSPEPSYWFPKPYADFVQRLRVASGFVLLLAFGFFVKPSLSSLEIGIPVSLVGLLLRGWAAGHLAKDRELATSGPYSYIRNPLYIGTLITALGLVLAGRSSVLAIVFSIVFLLVYLPAVELEEQHLRRIFSGYADYARNVNRFLPLRRYRSGGGHFAASLYLRNEEYKAAAGWLIAVAWLIWRYFRVPYA
jgi:protein-S-isoprenylcysteine O-methyltransferase Ste14